MRGARRSRGWPLPGPRLDHQLKEWAIRQEDRSPTRLASTKAPPSLNQPLLELTTQRATCSDTSLRAALHRREWSSLSSRPSGGARRGPRSSAANPSQQLDPYTFDRPFILLTLPTPLTSLFHSYKITYSFHSHHLTDRPRARPGKDCLEPKALLPPPRLASLPRLVPPAQPVY